MKRTKDQLTFWYRERVCVRQPGRKRLYGYVCNEYRSSPHKERRIYVCLDRGGEVGYPVRYVFQLKTRTCGGPTFSTK